MILPSSCLILIVSILLSPSTEFSWYWVSISILSCFSNSLTLWILAFAPLNSSLRCISLTLELVDSSIAQSKAESPPPNIEIALSLNIVLSLIEYNISFPSNFSHSFTKNFLGSKEPTPPAIIIFGALNSFPLFVLINQFMIFQQFQNALEKN